MLPNTFNIFTAISNSISNISNSYDIKTDETKEAKDNKQQSILTNNQNIPTSNFTFKKYGALCLSAGSIKGLIILGALHELWLHNQLQYITYYAGTSIGSIISLLLSIGYSPMEILISYCDPQFINQYNNVNLTNIGIIHGIFPHSFMRKKLEDMIMLKIGYIPTLGELRDKHQKYLLITTYCHSEPDKNKRKVYLSPDTHPHMSSIDAVILSSSVPILFEKSMYNDQVYIDGAYTSSFPIDKLQQIIPRDCMILGLNLVFNDPKCDTLFNYMISVMYIPIEHNNEINIRDKSQCVIIDLLHNDYHDSFTLNISMAKRMAMFSDGTKQIKNLINKIKYKAD